MKDRETWHIGGRRVGHNLATEQQLNKKLKAISHPYLLKKDKRSLLLGLFGTGNNIKTAPVGCHLHPAPGGSQESVSQLPGVHPHRVLSSPKGGAEGSTGSQGGRPGSAASDH